MLVPKSGKAFACTFDDYREISLLTSFNKILERLILSGINQKSLYRLHELQGLIGVNMMPCMTTGFVFDETKHCRDRWGDKVYVCYIMWILRKLLIIYGLTECYTNCIIM